MDGCADVRNHAAVLSPRPYHLLLLVPALLASAGTARASEQPARHDELGVANVAASSVSGKKAGRLAARNAIDGDAATAWRPDPKHRSPQWLQLDFGDRVSIDHCSIRLLSPASAEPATVAAEALAAKLVLSNKFAVAVAGLAPTAQQPIDSVVGGRTSRTVRLVVGGSSPLPPGFAVAEFSCFGVRKLEASPRSQQQALDQKYEQEHRGRFRPRPRVPLGCRTENVPDGFLHADTGGPTVHSVTLVEYYASCGSPCGHSVFVDCTSGKVSEPHFIPIAVDSNHDLLLNADSGKLTVRSIFTNEVVKTIERPAFKPLADLSNAVDGRFSADGTLRLWYTDLRDNPVVELVAP
jgi:hypothetical protein